MQFETISVIGLGYIGLPTAAMFASRQKKVIGVDINQHAVDTINQGKIHIVEPDLDTVVHEAVSDGYLHATTKPQPADAFMIAVPTPFKKDSYEPDLSYIKSAVELIAPCLKKGDLVVLESTSPVGATEQMALWLSELRSDLSFPQDAGDDSDIRVAHCPERVLPGKVMQELISNDRLIGGMTDKCNDAALSLYKIFVEGECISTNARTAEMAKLTENSFRDVNIAFANELSVICDKLDINVWELISLANRHPRVNVLQPGPGVGGHCIAVDPWFIVSSAPEEARLIKTARTVNDNKPEWVLEKVRLSIADYLLNNTGKTVSDISIVCYGITFKPDIDDLRESPSLDIVEKVTSLGLGRVLVVEPNIVELPESLKAAELIDINSGMEFGHIHLLLVDHKEFIALSRPDGYLVDTRGVWEV